MDKIKVLFLAANPTGSPLLKLDEEIRSITEKIRSAKYRDSLELVSVWAVRPDDLLQSLLEHKPHILHFSGHGRSTGEIILTDDNGYSKPVNAAALKSILTVLKDNLQVVVLNACHSQIQAEAIAETINCVIGMSHEISDLAAITFAGSFYRALGFDRSIEEAFNIGKAAIEAEGFFDQKTPQLLIKRGIDLSHLFLRGHKPYGYLLLIENTKVIKRFPLTNKRVVIGRYVDDHEYNIQIPNRFKKVSRQHAAITTCGEEVFIKDLASKNGTYVEGLRLEQQLALKSGQQIILGSDSPHEKSAVLEFSLDPFGSTD